MKQYSTETQCREYLASLRWKSGYVCPRCGCHHVYRLANGRYQCARCRHQASVTAETVLYKTHMPLTQWFLTFYFVCQNKRGNPRFLRMQVTPNIKQASVTKFAHAAFDDGSVIHSDGYRSYIPALDGYTHEHRTYDSDSGLLHWLHVVISNANAFILGTYHGLLKKNLQSYLDEYSFRFNRRHFGPALVDRLALSVSLSRPAV